jgi:hypothetical protein
MGIAEEVNGSHQPYITRTGRFPELADGYVDLGARGISDFK